MPVQCTCLQCGQTYFRKPSKAGPYCSFACNGARKRIESPSICEACGKDFLILFNRTLRRRFCSKRCWGNAYRETATQIAIERNRIWSDEETAYLIEHYPTDGSASVAKATGKTARQVRDKVDNLKHGEGIRLTLTDECFRKVTNLHPSSLEISLAAMLRELGVAFEPHYLIKPNFIVDFRLGPLIIEADGDWWHGHPRYEPLTQRQMQQQKRDAARNAYLAECGYTVVRIWESDLSLDLLKRVLEEHHATISPRRM